MARAGPCRPEVVPSRPGHVRSTQGCRSSRRRSTAPASAPACGSRHRPATTRRSGWGTEFRIRQISPAGPTAMVGYTCPLTVWYQRPPAVGGDTCAKAPSSESGGGLPQKAGSCCDCDGVVRQDLHVLQRQMTDVAGADLGHAGRVGAHVLGRTDGDDAGQARRSPGSGQGHARADGTRNGPEGGWPGSGSRNRRRPSRSPGQACCGPYGRLTWGMAIGSDNRCSDWPGCGARTKT